MLARPQYSTRYATTDMPHSISLHRPTHFVPKFLHFLCVCCQFLHFCPIKLPLAKHCMAKDINMQLHLGEAVTTSPTVGSNVEQIQFKNLTFEVTWLPASIPQHSGSVTGQVRSQRTAFVCHSAQLRLPASCLPWTCQLQVAPSVHVLRHACEGIEETFTAVTTRFCAGRYGIWGAKPTCGRPGKPTTRAQTLSSWSWTPLTGGVWALPRCTLLAPLQYGLNWGTRRR